MFVALKSGLAAKSLPGVAKELCKVHTKKRILNYQVANLMRASLRNEDEIPNIRPFPYHEKEMTVFQMLIDTHKCRVHQHSKLIIVDGQVASGKNKLAKELAEQFDFLYLPAPTFDDLLITAWGFDVRTLDHKLPKNVQSWDIERFLQNPTDINTASMQEYMLMMRMKHYMRALAHILCTGQGVVHVRSPWTDQVFAKAMAQSKFISPGALESHTDNCNAALHFLMKPHAVIYLDVPVDRTLQNIKKRNLPHERNSPVLNEKYLTDIEENHKKDYLSKISRAAHLLIYDWSHGGDTEVVVEDLENLQWDGFRDDDPKMQDWRFTGYDYKVRAKNFTYDQDMYLGLLDIMRTDVPELMAEGHEFRIWDEVWSEVEDAKYERDYNPLKGDKNILMKMNRYLHPDHVTPLIKKYEERKLREKNARKAKN
ncbi:hypothetical protein QAD02_024200 [Eretmocerus hayati]|uniref:Uncharacterized protein n=1 Tax=Eretmocerus hayati TaxID=131215 RepID=A0ACC2PXS3_9HYME|nr:hypothetical protein QAD02_024200 [Eretmocerus hayati]